jgi:hypothetical protein
LTGGGGGGGGGGKSGMKNIYPITTRASFTLFGITSNERLLIISYIFH